MSAIDEAKQALLDLHDLTVVMADAGTPDPLSVMGYQSKILRLYTLIGEEMARQFGTKERAYLTRKIDQAKAHAHGRIELGLTSKDSEERAFQSVKGKFDDEIEAMERFELYRVMLKSLQNGFEHTRSVVSFLKSQEANPTEQ